MYNNKVIIHKRGVITPIPDYMILVDFCQIFLPIIDFTTDDMITKFGLFLENKTNALYITEIIQTYWIHMLDEYLEEEDTAYSYDFNFCTNSCFNISMNYR